MKRTFFSLLFLIFLASCASDRSIVSHIDEKEANEIVVFLASKGISAQKVEAPSSGAAGVGTQTQFFNISVSESQMTEAMALLNQYGLPRRQGTNLLTLFAGGGLVASDKEETIRYQAGLAQELSNTIRKMDGILDADVQISFPQAETAPNQPKPKITAAVYVKHQGIMEDPNSHVEIKIKRLMAGSVNGLDFENVSVISDRARLADIVLDPSVQAIGPKSLQESYVKMWGMVLTKASLTRFRFIFFFFVLLLLGMSGLTGWLLYKFYPLMQRKQESFKTPNEE